MVVGPQVSRIARKSCPSPLAGACSGMCAHRSSFSRWVGILIGHNESYYATSLSAPTDTVGKPSKAAGSGPVVTPLQSLGTQPQEPAGDYNRSVQS